jgi:uncharacterized protein involved in exopolysaccharide biosynthesis
MRLPKVAGWLRAGACGGLVCAMAAGVVSFAWPDRYVSSALLRFQPRYVPEQALEGRRVEIHLRLNAMVGEVLSRSSLARIIQSPWIDLYTRERRSSPLEDVIENMRKQVRVNRDDPAAAAFRVSFEYADARKAQFAVKALVTALVEGNERINRSPGPAEHLEILEAASLPERPAGPDRYAIAGIGLGAGFVLGVAGFGLWRIVRRRALGMTAAVLGCGALGAMAAGLAAYVISERYESTAVLRMYAAAGTMAPAEDARERLAEITNEVLSRSSLSELVLRPALDLYRGERQRRPMEEIIGNMRANDLRIEHTPGPILAVRIFFAYADPLKAQAVVKEIVTKFIEANGVIERRRNRGETRAGTIVMDVLDPASLPEDPLFPQPAATMAAAAGAGAGAGIAWLLAILRRRPRGQAAAMLKMSAAGGAAGALLATAIAFALPDRYVSTAVLMIRPGTGQKVTARHVADYVRQETPVILSRSHLAELIRRPALDLYRGERARHPLEQVIDQMREDIRIEWPAPAPLASTVSIAFTYSERTKAQAVVRSLVTKFTESPWTDVRNKLDFEPRSADAAVLEVLDAASLPEAPVWPPRGGIIAGGLLAGLLLGPAMVWWWRRRPARLR